MWFDITEIPIAFHEGSQKKKDLFSKEWLIKNGLEHYVSHLEWTRDKLFEKFKVDEYH